jgi:glycosyltransferase involved in cell wall biosynthesis
MKVLWLAQHPIPSTQVTHPASWITALAEELSERGVTLTIITTGKRLNKNVQEYDLGTYKVIALNMPSGYLDVVTLFNLRIRILKDYVSKISHEFDIIHAHGTERQFASALESNHIKIPALISIQGLIFQCKKYIKDFVTIRRAMWEISSFYEKREIIRNKYFVCRTHWDKASILSLNPNAKIFEIWELMRHPFYEAEVKLGENILFSGGNNDLKGFTRCLKVFDSLLKNNDLKLHIIGKCNWQDVKKVQKKHLLHNLNRTNIILHGVVSSEQIIDLYNDCFCLYHPSMIDNSPNSICEAQLAGLPVVATNTGGVSSLIDDKVTGFLLGNNINADIETINSLKKNKSLQNLIAREAQGIAKERHNIKTIINNVTTMYKYLIDEVGKSSL